MKKVLLLACALLCVWTNKAQADDPHFAVTANSADLITPIGGPGVFGWGIYAESMYPLSSAFSAFPNGAPTTQMRFQVPVGFGAEISLGITRQIEIAVEGGLDFFETSAFLANSTGGSKVYGSFQYSLYPVEGILRYRLPKKSWAPEAEIGGGAAFGSITSRVTETNEAPQTDAGPFLRGHVAVGAAFSWSEDASLHIQVGYEMEKLGAKTYYFDNFTTQQQATFSGVFTKAFLKFY